MRAYQFATVRPAATVFHMQPVGNRHTLCGRIAEHTEDMYVAARAENFATRRLCKTCAMVKPARDTRRPVDPYLSEPTDTWTVTNRAGDEIARVQGTTMGNARKAADALAFVRSLSRREGGFSLRRMTVGELRAAKAVDALFESAWSTMTLHTILRREFGITVDGRRVICAALAAQGITWARVRALNV